MVSAERKSISEGDLNMEGKVWKLTEHLAQIGRILLFDFEHIATVKEHGESFQPIIKLQHKISMFQTIARKLDTPEGNKATMLMTAEILEELAVIARWQADMFEGQTFEELTKEIFTTGGE